MRELKKIVIKGLLFTGVFAAMYLAAVFVLVKINYHNASLIYRFSDAINWKGGNSYQKFRDFKKDEKYDVIVIGSSHAYRGYDPRIFRSRNLKMFNLGTSGQSLLNSYYIAKNYITPANCKMVILDIYDGALSVDGMESTADLAQNIDSDKAAFEMCMALKDPRAINMMAVRSFKKNEPVMYIDSNYVMNGYSETKDSFMVVNKSVYNARLEPNEVQVAYLKCLLEYFSSNNIRVVAVTHPAPKEKNAKNHRVFYELVSDICEKYNVTYMDYSFSHDLHSQHHFYDTNHLNQFGVNIFNEVLLNYLFEKHIFVKEGL